MNCPSLAIKLLENIKFRDTKSHFQDTVANDIKKINSSDKMFVFADKTRNIYETSLDTYNKLLHDNITKTYKRRSEGNISEINNELKHIANKLSFGNRIECMKKCEAFISLKDHKDGWVGGCLGGWVGRRSGVFAISVFQRCT